MAVANLEEISIGKRDEDHFSENYKQSVNPPEINVENRCRKGQRSNDQVIIFLYGISGSGKSTTLNYLFGSEIIPTSRERSETRKVTEYGCFIKSSRKGKDNSIEISFIDTPGLYDTSGNKKDSLNLVQISNYIESHPNLCTFNQRAYPNIVLIVVSASDQRLNGIYSCFSKMLHVLTKLNVVDILHPNAVIVVTNAMHFARKEYGKETKKLEKICKSLTRAHFSIEVPVVFIENLDKREELAIEGDWKILPDGTKQPLNLFDAMINLMELSGDQIGVEAVRLSFSESKNYKFEELRNSTQNSFEAKECSKWNEFIGEDFFSESDSKIYSVFKTNKIVSDDIWIFPLIYQLQKNKIVNPIDLRKMNLTKIKQVLQPFLLTTEETDWLIGLFEVIPIIITLNFKLLGLGYSRQFKDMRKKILEIGPLESGKCGNYEIDIPDHCSAKYLNQITVDILYDEKSKWFRMRYLSSRLTFRICYILFQVDIDELKSFNLNSLFVNKLKKSLPKGIDPTNLEYKFENPDFTNFVQHYGLNCTTGLYFGGFVKGVLYFDHLKDEERNREFLAEKADLLSKQLKTFFHCIQNGTNPDNFQIDEDVSRKLEECSLTWGGGNKKYHSGGILEIDVNSWNEWKNSIEENVVCLDWMVNSVSLLDILRQSFDENIAFYAQEFSNIMINNQTGLTQLNFIDAVDFPKDQRKDIRTRIEAVEHPKVKCVLL